MTTGLQPLAAPACLLLGAFVSLMFGRKSGAAGITAIISGSIAAVLGTASALGVLRSGEPWGFEAKWSLPWSTFSVGMDGLSAFFVAFILILAVPAAVYGRGYLAHHGNTWWTGVSWAFFQLLVASMVMVVLSRDGMLFLLAWEAMSVSSFFLVIYDHERPEVRSDALVYLTATHLGAAALAAMFGLWGSGAGSLDFAALQAAQPGPKAMWAVFVLAIAGFGSKAGLAPFHVWLPKAHPAAPSHVSALMSGVMIKMGVYGLMRIVLMVAAVPAAWGYVLITAGALSAVAGALYALAQKDIKRVLAYSSVENAGIITIGLGAGLLARSAGMEAVAVAALCGSLLHVLNHGLFKSLLFYAGGAAAQGAGTREMEKLGGLIKKMPVTGAAFLAGSASICALPPFNGFISEWFIYIGLFTGTLHGRSAVPAVLFAAIPVLALSGGLALACFSRAFGIVFLGEPRSGTAANCKEPSAWMTVPMVFTAAACAAAGLASPFLLWLVAPAADALAGVSSQVSESVSEMSRPLSAVMVSGWILVVLTAALLWIRRLALNKKPVGEGPTWGCGYTAPSSRMQYTASSFAAPLLDPLRNIMRPAFRKNRPKGVFPQKASFRSDHEDPADRAVFDPVIGLLGRAANILRPLQAGRLQIYVLYILVTLVALLAWKAFS